MSVVTWETIIAGIQACLSVRLPATSTAVTTDKYLRHLAPYFGQLLDDKELLAQGGVAGRCPAMLVAFSGEQTFKSTLSRKRDRMQAMFTVICCTDVRRDRDSYAAVLYPMLRDARALVAGRRLGAKISPMHPEAVVLVKELDTIVAWGWRFSTIYSVDYFKTSALDKMLSFDGSLRGPDATPIFAPPSLNAAVVGTPGAISYGYQIVAETTDGSRSGGGPLAEVHTGTAALGATLVRLTWPASAQPAALYHVFRVESGGSGNSATLGKIGQTAGLTFDDVGAAATVEEPHVRSPEELVGRKETFA